MRKILWYSAVNELDYEMQLLFDRLPGYEIRMAVPTGGNDYFFPVPIRIEETNVVTVESMRTLLRAYQPDLLVHRYRREHAPILEAAEAEGVPVLIWVTEQGPDRDLEWNRNRYFRNLAANNPWDVEYFKSRGVENVYYLPFGYLPFFHRPVPAEDRFKTDFVVYGNPIYNLYASKRESVDTVVLPIVQAGYQLSAWGRRRGEAGGWLDVPGILEGVHYKGKFNYDELSAVNSSAKVVLGITSNGRYGAFGSRLARALGSRAFCIWAYSEGMEEMSEGFKNGVNCCWSKHPEETLELARYYLKNESARLKVAEAGQKLAFEKLNLHDLVLPIVDDMIARQPRRAHSRYYAMGRGMEEAAREGRPARTLECGYQLIAHDACGVHYETWLGMSEAYLALGKSHLCMHYLRRFHEEYGATQRRLKRSAERPAQLSRVERLYRGIATRVAELLSSGADVSESAELCRLLEGVLQLEDAAQTLAPLFATLARCFAQGGYRQGECDKALRAFNLYVRLYQDPEAAGRMPEEIARQLLLCFPTPSASRNGAVHADADEVFSRWELFVRVADRLPLDRTRVLLAGDILEGQAEYVAHNVAPVTWLRNGPTGKRFEEAGWGDIPNLRAAVKQAASVAALADLEPADALLYFALSDGAAEQLSALTAWLPRGACVIVVGAAEVSGMRRVWSEEWHGHRDLDFAARGPLSGALRVHAYWKEASPTERLITLVGRLSDRMEPRISQVTLDPREILLARYAWADGYVRVMEHDVRADGFEACSLTVQAPPVAGQKFGRDREHTLLEVVLDGQRTTWDPMLGIGYDCSVEELLADPRRAATPLGGAGRRHWAKYGLDAFTGSEFWAAVRGITRRPNLEEQPRFDAVAAAREVVSV
ncbi:MAG: glycosyltransferase [Armatimonadetes bacterium]|nr:glycosyltransferase [Armatimonadota bacterium]